MTKFIKNNKSFGFSIAGIVIIIAAIAILGGGYWYWQSSTEVPLPPSSDQNPVVAEGDFTGWKTYRNEKYGFEVRYPPDYKIDQSSEATIELSKFLPNQKECSGWISSFISVKPVDSDVGKELVRRYNSPEYALRLVEDKQFKQTLISGICGSNQLLWLEPSGIFIVSFSIDPVRSEFVADIDQVIASFKFFK